MTTDPIYFDVGRDLGLEGHGQRPPAYGEVETGRVGVQPRTSSRDASAGIGDDDALDHDHPHQVGAAAPARHPMQVRTGVRASGRETGRPVTDESTPPTGCSFTLTARPALVVLPGGGGVGPDVDPPPGEARSEAGVLALLADGERELVVRDDDARRAVELVDHGDGGDLRRRQRVAHQLGGVVRPVDDVDLLAVQLGRDGPDPLPIGPMQAPFALRPSTVERTAIFVRWPASRAIDSITTEPSAISGTSSANSERTRFGWVRETVTRGPRGVFATDTTWHLSRLPWTYFSPGTCSCGGRTASILPRSTNTRRGSLPCWMIPDTRSPSVPANSPNVTSSSASRSRCRMT